VPIYYVTGPVKVTYNGIDLTPYVDQDDAQVAVRTIDVSGMDWSKRLFSVICVRPVAPIRACLWRRNLDGGQWRRRGHVAHRG
jgi:hypothetical protein